MSRNGINYDQVSAVADNMIAEEITPTINGVRERLGTGSCNTIQRHLAAWRESRPQHVTNISEIPTSIKNAIFQEIDRSESAARSEIANRLILIQAEANELASSGEKLEAEIEILQNEVSALTSQNALLADKLQDQDRETEQLVKDCERERYSADQARIEVAQLRNKLDIQSERFAGQAVEIEQLKTANANESQARIMGEKELAVLNVKFDSEKENNRELIRKKDALAVKIDAERQSAEKARIDAAKVTNELELKSAVLVDNINAFRELTAFFETERNARIADEKSIAVLNATLEELRKTVKHQSIYSIGKISGWHRKNICKKYFKSLKPHQD